jgi:hypothetical protein
LFRGTIVRFVEIGGIGTITPLNTDGQQFHQYQQKEQSPLKSDGQQFHQYQQNDEIPLNSDGH